MIIPPKIVGVLNVTPDSFSDGGEFLNTKKALERAEKIMQEGADLVDIGAESSAPHNAEISAQEEWARLENILPVLLEKKIPLSLDSQKYEIWEKFLEKGGEMINDVSGLKKDTQKKIELLQKFPKTKIVIMFSRDILYPDPENLLKNILPEISEFFYQKILFLTNAGIELSRIILDPGMGGFLSKNPEISFAVLHRLSELQKFNCPLYVGTSRKSFLAAVSGNKHSSHRVISSVVSSLMAVQNGAEYIRVHDVAEMKEAINTWEKISEKNSFDKKP